jgi:hypothetical protein
MQGREIAVADWLCCLLFGEAGVGVLVALVYQFQKATDQASLVGLRLHLLWQTRTRKQPIQLREYPAAAASVTSRKEWLQSCTIATSIHAHLSVL